MHRKRKRRTWILLVVTLLGAMVLLWFLPALFTVGPIKQYALGRATKGFAGEVTVGKLSLGWISPVVLSDVEVMDADGQLLLEASSLRTENALLALMLDRSALGGVHVERPCGYLRLRGDGSNVEDVIRPWLTAPESGEPVPSCVLVVHDGMVAVSHEEQGRQWRFEGLNLSLELPRGDGPVRVVHLESQLLAPVGPVGKIQVDLQWPGGSVEDDEGQLVIHSTALPLDLAGAVLGRFVAVQRLEGALYGSLRWSWQGRQSTLHVEQLHVDDLVFASPALLGSDQVQLVSCEAGGKLQWGEGSWRLQDGLLASDLARFDATGAGSIPRAPASTARSLALDVLGNSDLRIHGEVDAARLAAMLPGTLRIRDGTRISSGRIALAVDSQPAHDAHQWDLQLRVEDLAAIYRNRQIQWDEPVEVIVAATQDQSSFTVRQLTCRSSFLNVTGEGSLTQGEARLAGDLAQFLDQAGQFVDFGQVQLAGNVNADIQWQAAESGLLTLSGRGTAKGLEVVLPQFRPWREQQLELTFDAKGLAGARQLERLDNGRIGILSGGDQLELELLRPVQLQPASSAWPLKLRVAGELARWLPRVQSFVSLGDLDLAGQGSLVAQADLSPNRVEIQTAKLTVDDLRVSQGDLAISEPRLQLKTSGIWDGSGPTLMVHATTLASTTVALQSDQLRMSRAGGMPQLDGKLLYRVQLEPVLQWLSTSNTAPTARMSGEASGELEFANVDQVTSAHVTADIEDFRFARRSPAPGSPVTAVSRSNPWETVWHEPRLTLACRGEYDAATAHVALETVEFAGEALQVVARGQVREPQGRCFVELDGEYAYDLQRLVPALMPELARNLQLVGRDKRSFRMQGPLVRSDESIAGGTASRLAIDQIQARAQLAWASAQIQGFAVGPAELDSRLDKGILSLAPLDIAVSEGRLKLAPTVTLDPTPAILRHPPGTIIEQVRLSPEMCRGWLKFAAPLAANATAAEGKFSVTLDEAALPLADPSAGDVRGTMAVHSARLGPGPLSREILLVAEQVRALVERRAPRSDSAVLNQWLELPSQNVGFQVVNGRVHHQGMQLAVGDVIVRTSGSVGFDESLSLVAEIPIRDEWIARDRYLSALRGQVLQLPIQGTLEKPRVDGRALSRLTQQAVGGAATRLLEQELGRGLDRLFRPRD